MFPGVGRSDWTSGDGYWLNPTYDDNRVYFAHDRRKAGTEYIHILTYKAQVVALHLSCLVNIYFAASRRVSL